MASSPNGMEQVAAPASPGPRTVPEPPRASDCSAEEEDAAVVVFLGDAFVDIQTSTIASLPAWGEDRPVASVSTFAGGCVCNTARRFGALRDSVGRPTPLLCCVTGGDFLGNWFRTILEEEGLVGMYAVSALPKGEPQSTCIVLTGSSDRAFVSCNSSNPQLNPFIVKKSVFTPLRMANKKIKHVHIGGYFCCPNLQVQDFASLLVMEKTKEPSMTISLDTNFDASGKWDGQGHLKSLLPLVDILFPNELEACGISGGAKTPELALETLTSLYPDCLVVITLGETGVIAGHGVLRYKFPGFLLDVSQVKDTTGAGDAFKAAFLSEYLDAGASGSAREPNGVIGKIELALQMGCAAGALCVGQHGACNEHFTKQNLLDFIGRSSLRRDDFDL